MDMSEWIEDIKRQQSEAMRESLRMGLDAAIELAERAQTLDDVRSNLRLLRDAMCSVKA